MATGGSGEEGALMKPAADLFWAVDKVPVVHLVAQFLPSFVPCFYNGIVLLYFSLGVNGNWVVHKFMKQINKLIGIRLCVSS